MGKQSEFKSDYPQNSPAGSSIFVFFIESHK